MRIAQIAPLWEAVPPKTYGGTELVVHLLCEEMVKLGHEVTLFACGSSRTSAKLVECSPAPLRQMINEGRIRNIHAEVAAWELKMLGEVFARADEFDIIHNHVGFQALPLMDMVETPGVTTLHNALEPQVIRDLFAQYKHLNHLSISNYQQQLWPELHYAATIYHGIEMRRFNPSFTFNDKRYLAFLGRMSPEKGPQFAIRMARELGWKLVMAGKIDRNDRAFYEREVEPLIDGEQVCYIGEVNHEQKVELLRNAAATLCPVQWPEPFGLVMVESMACGTPVFALRDGSIPEVIDNGVTGFIGDTVEELIEELKDLPAFDRKRCRRVAERRFSSRRMAQDHLVLYERLIEEKRGIAQASPALTPVNIATAKNEAMAREKKLTGPLQAVPRDVPRETFSGF